MAKNEKITLTLDFDIERAKLQEVGNLLGKDMEKGLKGTKTTEYFNSVKTAVTDTIKTVGTLYSSLSKPLVSKSQAKELASSLESTFKSLDNKLLSLQGNISKTFNSTSNVAAIKQIRQIGDELDKLTADYQAVSQLLGKSKGLGNKSELKSQLSSASKELDALTKKQNDLTAQEKKQQDELKQTITEINKKLEEKAKIQEQINSIHASSGVTSQAELSGLIENKVGEQQGLINGSISVQDVETLKNALAQIRDIIQDIMRTSNATAPKVMENMEGIIEQQRAAEEQSRTFKSVLKDLGIPILGLHELARGMRRIVSYSYEYIKNLDAALTEIAIVSGKSRSEVLALTDTFIELSAKTGMAIDDIAKASTIYYQQGLNDEAVKKLTEYTAIFAKISNETVEVASNQITAAINGFNLSVDQAGEVIDKLSVLAAYSAADIDELATAMSKAASQANMAGLSFDQYNAYLATMIEVTREAPENIGTSLKTIMSRFQSIKKGENTEDDTDVNAVEKALKSVGVQLRDAEGQLRDLGDVLEELGPKWNGLSRNTQAYLGTVIAGTRQQSRFISLMQNWDRALELTTASQNSAGAATRMHQSAMEGLDAALNNLTNAWQKLISNLANGDSFKFLINTATAIVKWFANGNSALKLFTVAITLLNAKTLLTNMRLKATGDSLKNMDTAVIGLKSHVMTLTKNIASLSTTMSKQDLKIKTTTSLIEKQAAAYRDLAAAQSGTTSGTNIATGGTGGTVNVPTPVVNAETVKKSGKEVKKFGDKVSGVGNKAKTAIGSVSNLIGGLQTGLMVGSLIMSGIELINDWLTTTSSEIRERAQKAYDATQKELDKKLALIDTVEASADVYDRLSKKMIKSAEEVQQLADATDALAKAAPGAIIGYDANGNPIINTNSARASAKSARREAAELAKTQMANLGGLARADLREEAENLWSSSDAGKGWSTAKTVGTVAGVGGLAGAGLVLMAVPEPTMVTKVIGGILLAISALGAATVVTSDIMEEAGISAQEMALAQKKATEIMTDETMQNLLKNMSYIINDKINDRTIEGVSEKDRQALASFLGKQWLESAIEQIKAESWTDDGKFDSEKFEEGFANLGRDWSKVLDKIGDAGLAKAAKGLNSIAEDLGDKTYGSVEKAIKELITDEHGLNISEDDPLFKTIQKAFMTAVYNGYENGIYAVVQDLESRKETALITLKAHYSEDSDEYKELEASYNKAIQNVKDKMTNNQVSFYDMIGLTDDVGLFNMVVDQYADTINNALGRSNEAAAVQSIAYLEEVKTQAEQKMEEITDKESNEYKKWEALAESAASSIEKAWNTMDISIDIPWEELWDDLDKLTKRTQTAWKSVFDIKSENGMDISQWENFTKIFDDINFDAFDDTQLLQYADALDTIAGSLTVVNGQIYANGEAVETIAELEEKAIQASIEETRQELINKQLELEARKAIIDAQVATLEWKIKVAEGSADAKELESKAEEAWLNASNKMNTFYIQNQGKVAEAMVKQYADAFSEVAIKYNQLQTAMSDGTITQGEVDAIAKSWKAAQDKMNLQSYSAELDEKGYNLGQLKSQLEAAKKASAAYQTQISNINLKLATLNSGIWSSKNGNNNGNKGSGDKLQQYIGKLKEIYNILNRIGVLEHRLSTLDAYADIAQGEQYGSLLKERVDYNKELLDQYTFLTKEQKKFTNGYKEFIGTVEGLEGVFDFDKFGQIIINWDKYTALQDKAAKGETTLKEKADDVYDTYTQMFEDLQGYFDKTIDYYKQVIKLQQEIIDSYKKTQNQLADAIKEIYKKILDTKLDAIDKEKEAIEELREAREQARKDQENAEAISGLQTNIQRTMMDTSGASDVAFIKAQKDMNEKLNEIAEDKYSSMLEDILDSLDDEKEALQAEFDAMFDQLDWLFEWLDNDIMGDESAIYDILKQTDEWNQSSFIERQEKLDAWKTDFATYYKSILENPKGIYGIYDDLVKTKQSISDLDEHLKTNLHQESADVQQTILKWQNSVNSTISSAVSAAGGGGSRKTITPGNNTKDLTAVKGNETDIKADANAYKDTSGNKQTDGYAFKVNDTVRSNVGNEVTGYDSDSKGNLKKPPNQWWGNAFHFGSKKATVISRDNYNGLNFYKIKLPSGVTHWVNGLQLKYKQGGFAYNTGPAWLDGTREHPEAVLNALQTEHFIKFTDALDRMFSNGNSTTSTSSVNIDNISFNVESMSSVEDGEAAFNMFVNKFKEIGNQTGIKINSFKNTL